MGFVFETYGRPIKFDKVTASTTATKIPVALRAPTTGTWSGQEAGAAFVSIEDNPIRFRYDGGTCSATRGHEINSGYSIVVRGVDAVKNFSFCSQSAGNAASVFITTYVGF